MYAFVTIASGRLTNSPTRAPFATPGMGITTKGIKKPIANRLANAAISAVRLFFVARRGMHPGRGGVEAVGFFEPQPRVRCHSFLAYGCFELPHRQLRWEMKQVEV